MASTVSEQPTARGGYLSLAVELVLEDQVCVARLSGELDVASVPRFADALAPAISRTRQRVILDLSSLDFVDAAGLGAIVAAGNALRSRSGELTIRAPSPFMIRLLEITGLAGLATEFASSGSPGSRSSVGS